MKDLETEYRNQVESEVPDLWDRINASLDEEEKKAPNKKKKSKIVMVRFGEIAAVAACLIISVVAIKNRLLVDNRASESAGVCYEASDAAASDAAKEACYEDSEANEAAVCEAAKSASEEFCETGEAEVTTDADALSVPSTKGETFLIPYETNDDGTYSYEGETYLFLLELTGTPEGSELPVSITVLSNREDVSFEEAVDTPVDEADFVIIEIK